MAHSNAELFSSKRTKQNKSVKSDLGLWHLLCTYVVKHAQGYTVLGPTSKKGKHACTTGMGCYKRHALQHSSFAAPPGSCDLLFTMQVQPVRATTPLALGWKNGARSTEKSDPSGWSGSPCAVLCVVSGAPVALLAHLVLDKPVRVGERGTGLSAVKLGPLRCCKEARWSSTCLFTLGAGCL